MDLNAYEMVFQEQFDQKSVTEISNRWRHAYYWDDRTLSGNGEQQYYIEPNWAGSTMSPFKIGNNVFTIVADKVPSTLRSKTGNLPYSSGMISSERLFSMQYGYFEIRAKMPAGKGFWPAFWMLPVDGSWPPELDVVEILGHQPSRLYGTLHYNNSSGSHVMDGAVAVNAFNSSTGFHTYGVDWQPDRITWYYDGVAMGSTTNRIKDQPMYLIANLAVGGYWPGNPDATTRFPAEMQIDWIRAYRKKDAIRSPNWPMWWRSPGETNYSTANTSGPKQTWNWSYSFSSSDVKVKLMGEWSRYLTGNNNANVLVGSEAPFQRLNGRGGNDVLQGGPGTDIFVMEFGGGHDVVLDFANAPGNSDKIELRWMPVRTFDHLMNWAVETKSGTILRLSQTDSVLLKGVRKASLKANQFVFVN